LRKLITGAVAASATLSLAAGAAVAQAPATGSFTATVTPRDAGTRAKPTNAKARFVVKVTTPNATADTIQLRLGRGLKLSGKGFKRCKAANLVAGGVSACPSGSKAGPTGLANALLGTGATAAPLNFDVHPFVESDTSLLFYLNQQGGGVQRVIRGKITDRGRTLTLTIPIDLRQPVPGVDASLIGLAQSFSAKAGRHYIVSSTGCFNRKWRMNARITFTARADGTPVPGPLTGSSSARCKK
jgi:hypothetical protein